ncbi:hypothetical protein GUK34_17460 [Rhizobium leguminosarum]|uniref:hypothetical protein n=1 Tax=Rhizobium ruizarguesonis TaxID=2081791 RepID=UPI0013B7E649|nr:hypothetical protein [Rhizobium ruizarguesonis]NEI06602.1 hypothetical protein [Rhizobium ruizarguesonis]
MSPLFPSSVAAARVPELVSSPQPQDGPVLLRRAAPISSALIAPLYSATVFFWDCFRDDEGYFGVFDERSAHAALACQALIDDRNLVAKALKKDADLDELSALISSDCR